MDERSSMCPIQQDWKGCLMILWRNTALGHILPSMINHLFSEFPLKSTKKDIVSAEEMVDNRNSSNGSWVSSAVHNCQKFCLAQVLPKKIYVLRKGKPAYSKTINLLDYFQTVQVQRLALKSKSSASPKSWLAKYSFSSCTVEDWVHHLNENYLYGPEVSEPSKLLPRRRRQSPCPCPESRREYCQWNCPPREESIGRGWSSNLAF